MYLSRKFEYYFTRINGIIPVSYRNVILRSNPTYNYIRENGRQTTENNLNEELDYL